MKFLHTMRLMAISLSACALASSVFADTANDHIFDYTEKYNYYAFDSEKITSDLAKAYFIFDDTFNYLGAVWFWREGSKKYYSVESGILMLSADSASQKSGAASYQLFFMDDLLKKVMLSGDMYWALNGFGIARWASGQLTSLNVSGSTCEPYDFNGTFKFRFNKSLTQKAAKNEISGLEQVITELERKGYISPSR